MIDFVRLAKGVATSRTLYGGVSLFGMLAANVRLQGTLWIGTTPVPLGDDGNVVLALVGLFFVVWGRLKAPGPLLEKSEHKASSTVEPSTPWERQDESKGFPRGV